MDINSIIKMIEILKSNTDKEDDNQKRQGYRIACADIIEQLRKMSDWRPIDTAPKHTEVLVWREDAGVFMAQLTTPDNVMSDQEIEEYFPDGFGDFEEWFCASYGWQEGSEKPTYWMPLPKPPSAQS